MPLDIQCPHCQKRLRAPDHLAGKQIKCPQCQGSLILPGAEHFTGSQVGGSDPGLLSGATNGPPGLQVTAQGAKATGTRAANAGGVSGTRSTKSAASTGGASGTQAGTQSSSRVAKWYMRTPDGQDFGPISRQDLDQWVGEGRLDAECMVLCEGWEQWKWAPDVYPQLTATSQPAMAGGMPALDDSLASLLGPSTGLATGGSLLDEEGPALTLAPPSGPPALPGSTLTQAPLAPPNLYAGSQSTALGGGGSSFGRSFGGEKSWLGLDIGVGISNSAMLIGTGCLVGLTIGYLGVWAMSGSTKPNFTLLGLIGMLSAWSALGLAAVSVVQLTGWVVCLRVPSKTGTSGLINGAIACIGVALFMAMLLSLMSLGMLGQLVSPSSMMTVTKYAPMGLILLVATAWALYASFLGKIAEYFGDRATSQQTLYFAGMQVAHVIWTGVALYGIDERSQTVSIIKMLISAGFAYGTFIWLAMIERTVRSQIRSST